MRIQYQRVKGHKAEWAARQAQLKREYAELEKDTKIKRNYKDTRLFDRMTGSKLARRYKDNNKPITYSNFLTRLQDPSFDPNTVGVRSIPDLLSGLLHKTANWVPENLKFDEHNLPQYLVSGQENHFKPLLEQLDEMPEVKANAARLHNLVYQPATEKYIQRYHPTAGMSTQELAKNYSGVELFDDWALPFKHNQNSVMVNHQIHTRMDFGFDEI